ncbi:MAG: NAD-dependent epimerase/dehydratase family protein [Pseudonocardia sp.]
MSVNGVLGTAVVTGGVGFIGRRLVHSLLEQGRRVRAIDRRPGAPEGCEHGLADLVDDDVTEALDGDVVFHLAGRPGVCGDDAETERKRLRDNVVATERPAVRLIDAPRQDPTRRSPTRLACAGSSAEPSTPISSTWSAATSQATFPRYRTSRKDS